MRRTAKPFGLLAVTALLLLPAPLHAEPGACDYAEARRLDDLEVPQARAALERNLLFMAFWNVGWNANARSPSILGYFPLRRNKEIVVAKAGRLWQNQRP